MTRFLCMYACTNRCLLLGLYAGVSSGGDDGKINEQQIRIAEMTALVNKLRARICLIEQTVDTGYAVTPPPSALLPLALPPLSRANDWLMEF